MNPLVAAVLAGVALGLQFNPLSSAVGCSIAAGLAGRPEGKGAHALAAAVVLAAAWVLGDFLFAAPVVPNVGRSARLFVLVVQGVVGLVVGYLLPAGAGVFVGRRVVKGLGWPSAIAVALAASVALSVLAPRIGDVVWGMLPASVRAAAPAGAPAATSAPLPAG